MTRDATNRARPVREAGTVGASRLHLGYPPRAAEQVGTAAPAITPATVPTSVVSGR